MTLPLASGAVTTEPTAGAEPRSIPPLFAQLVDDTSLLQPRGVAPTIEEAVARHLAARDEPHGGVIGHLACPASRLSALVKELARHSLERPVELSLVVDTGLGAVPKSLSTVFSRPALLVPRTVETAAPPDVDGVWLDRVAEFVPEDVIAVVEPRRPPAESPEETGAWLAAVRRVADQGCAPRLRCGGARPSDVPEVEDVEKFVRVVVETGRGFTALGVRELVRPEGGREHGVLNLLVAVSRAIGGDDVPDALRSTDADALAAELRSLSPDAAGAVRALLARCGAVTGPIPAGPLVGMGLIP